MIIMETTYLLRVVGAGKALIAKFTVLLDDYVWLGLQIHVKELLKR